MIQAVIFDWGGVLIKNPVGDVIAYWSSKLGIPEKELAQICHQYAEDLYTATISEKAFWDMVSVQYNKSMDTSDSLIYEAFSRVYSPRREMFDFVTDVHNAGYKTCLLSNAEVAGMRYFYDHKLDIFFDAVVFSCTEYVQKPDAAIYEIALARLNVKPNEAIFIDDLPANIEGAKKIGLRTILYQSTEQVKREVKTICDSI